MWEWKSHLGSNTISNQRKTCHKPICFHYRYLDATYSLPRNHWRGMIKFFLTPQQKLLTKYPLFYVDPTVHFFLHCWKADQPTRSSTSQATEKCRMFSELLVHDEEITLWNGASLELETQRKLKTHGKKANTTQVTHREKVVKQNHRILVCINFSGTLTKRQCRNKPETFQNTEKAA